MRLPPVLVTNRAFRALWASRVISFAGDGVAAVALVLLAADAHGPAGVSLLLLALAVPRFLGPVAGAFVDRVEQRALMRACEVGQGGLIAAIAITLPPFPVVLALVAGTGLLITLFQPAGRSAVATLVVPEHRLSANALLGLAQNLDLALGGLIGGVLVAALGIRTALLVDAASFLVSAALLSLVPRLRPVAEHAAESFVTTVRGGLRYARGDRLVRALVISTFVVVALAALDNVALVFVAREVLGGGPDAYGFLVAAFGIGMIAASVTLAMRRTADGIRLITGGITLTGAGNIFTGLAPSVAIAGIAQAVGGVGNGVQNVATDTLVQNGVPRAMLGRVFGLIGTAAQLGQVVALGLAALLLEITSPRVVFVASGLAILAVAGLLARTLRAA